MNVNGVLEHELFRKRASYVNCSERFTKIKNDFSKQYCSLYTVRLEKMNVLLQAEIDRKWKGEYPVCKLYKLAEINYPKCIVFGTLYKDQKLKPSILKELAEINSLTPQPFDNDLLDESDSLYIEDEQQRYQIEGDLLNSNYLVNGIVCALLGSDKLNGKFLVEDFCFVNFQPQIPRSLIENDIFVVLISGLDIKNKQKSAFALNTFIEWLMGLGDSRALNVARVILAGNCIESETVKREIKISMTSRGTLSSRSLETIQNFDLILSQLCKSIEVDVMPGEFDPSNYILPQKPMNFCMFPHSIQFKSSNLVSNPYECNVENVKFLGSSGQPINNILKFSNISGPLEALKLSLVWSHLAPTAPDTLGCFPFYESDPFIIEECPHVYFAGNQDKFETEIVKGSENQEVRLICVPKFSTTNTVALLNLRTLDCTSINFNF